MLSLGIWTTVDAPADRERQESCEANRDSSRSICRPHSHESDDRRWDQIPGWMAPLWQVSRPSTPALLLTRGPLRFGRTRFLASGTVIFSPSGQRLSKHLPFEHWVTNVYRKLRTQCPLPVSGKGECPGQVSVRYNEIDGGIVKFMPNYLLLPTYFKPQKQKTSLKRNNY